MDIGIALGCSCYSPVFNLNIGDRRREMSVGRRKEFFRRRMFIFIGKIPFDAMLCDLCIS